jgi:hypothetical protein
VLLALSEPGGQRTTKKRERRWKVVAVQRAPWNDQQPSPARCANGATIAATVRPMNAPLRRVRAGSRVSHGRRVARYLMTDSPERLRWPKAAHRAEHSAARSGVSASSAWGLST